MLIRIVCGIPFEEKVIWRDLSVFDWLDKLDIKDLRVDIVTVVGWDDKMFWKEDFDNSSAVCCYRLPKWTRFYGGWVTSWVFSYYRSFCFICCNILVR
jgi:hypothetical protein